MKIMYWVMACATAGVVGCSHTGSKNNFNQRKLASLDQEIAIDDFDEYQSPKVKQWVDQHRARTRAFIDNDSMRPTIEARIKELRPKVSPLRLPFAGNFEGKEVQIQTYVDSGALVAEIGGLHKVNLVNATDLKAGEAIFAFKPSPNGKFLAYGVVFGGSDWQTWHVVSVPQTKTESVRRVSGPIPGSGMGELNWSVDSSGLYYTDFGDPALYESGSPQRVVRVKFHLLGRDVNLDPVIYEDTSERPPLHIYSAYDTVDGNVVVYRFQGAAEIKLRAILLKKADAFSGNWNKYVDLIEPFKYHGKIVGIVGNKIYMRSTICKNGGDFYCVISVSTNSPTQIETVVPPKDDHMMLQAWVVGPRVIMQYFKTTRPDRISNKVKNQFHQVIASCDLNGKNCRTHQLADQNIFPVGVVSYFNGFNSSDFMDFTISTALDGVISFRLNAVDGSLQKTNSPVEGFDKSKIKVELVEFKSHGGQNILMHVFSRKDMAPGKKFSLGYLFAYGWIGIGNFPPWNLKFQSLLEMGAVLGVAYPRGGGEFGVNWQKLGREPENHFEDVANAARYLRKKYDIELDQYGQKRLVKHGRSFGGYFTFGMMARYNDLFSAFIPGVPLFEVNHSFKKGIFWWVLDDYNAVRGKDGKIANVEAEVENLNRWDAVTHFHKFNVAKPTLIETGTLDTRVKPTQPYRATYTLFKKFDFNPDIPVYLLAYENTGHFSRPEAIDEVTWLAKIFGIKEYNPIK